MADFVELWVDQGANLNHTLTLSDDITGSNVNVDSYTFMSQMRRSYYSPNAVNIVCTKTDVANGKIQLSLTGSVTANIKPNRYVFDVKAVNDENNISRVLEGIITVTPSVTR